MRSRKTRAFEADRLATGVISDPQYMAHVAAIENRNLFRDDDYEEHILSYIVKNYGGPQDDIQGIYQKVLAANGAMEETSNRRKRKWRESLEPHQLGRAAKFCKAITKRFFADQKAPIWSVLVKIEGDRKSSVDVIPSMGLVTLTIAEECAIARPILCDLGLHVESGGKAMTFEYWKTLAYDPQEKRIIEYQTVTKMGSPQIIYKKYPRKIFELEKYR
jgi:hypothetical protein